MPAMPLQGSLLMGKTGNDNDVTSRASLDCIVSLQSTVRSAVDCLTWCALSSYCQRVPGGILEYLAHRGFSIYHPTVSASSAVAGGPGSDPGTTSAAYVAVVTVDSCAYCF